MDGLTILECFDMCLAALLAVFQARFPMSSIILSLLPPGILGLRVLMRVAG